MHIPSCGERMRREEMRMPGTPEFGLSGFLEDRFSALIPFQQTLKNVNEV